MWDAEELAAADRGGLSYSGAMATTFRAAWLVLLALGGCTSVIGNPCETSQDCRAGNVAYVCDESLPGGSCTRPCSVEGLHSSGPGYSVTNCWLTRDMAEGACARVDVGHFELQCMRLCRDTTDCRAGYECRPVPGGIETKACLL